MVSSLDQRHRKPPRAAIRSAFLGIVFLGAASTALASPLRFTFAPTGALASLESTDPEVFARVTGGFATAGAYWSSQFHDDATINVTIDFPVLQHGIAGWAENQYLAIPYADIRAALARDGTSADDAVAVASLPSGASLSFLTNDTTTGDLRLDDDGSTDNTVLDVARANLKALGFFAPGFLEPNDAVHDAAITFSSAIDWDFDRSDGIGSRKIDFVGVAIHELGHAMGFLSGVDTVDYYSAPFGPEPGRSLEDVAVFSILDLFRHGARNGGGLDFATGGMDGDTPYFSLDGGLTSLGMFSTGLFNGEGRQASHWTDAPGTGIMAPAFFYGELKEVTSLDLRAFDAIGYDVAVVPEIDPAGIGGVLAVIGGAIGLLERRRLHPRGAP